MHGVAAAVFATLQVLVPSTDALQRWTGTWMLVEGAASPGEPGPAAATVTMTRHEGGLLTEVTTTDALGRAERTRVLARFDGRDTPVEGLPDGVTRAFSWLDGTTHEWVTKNKGEPIATTRATLSPDGLSFTVLTRGRTPQGQVIDTRVVYRRVSGQ